MLFKLDRYLLRNNLGLLAALIAVSLAVLMLERLIRITDLIAGSDNALQSAARMIGNLLPHYLGMALPGALLIALVITIERLSRSGEIVALMSTGVSLRRIVRPYIGLAVVLALTSVLISGFLQPISRYNYRQIVHELKQSSIVTAFQERKFVQFDDKVVWTSKVNFAGRKLGETFILETGKSGNNKFITGHTGVLREDDDGTWTINLQDAMIGDLPAEITSAQGSRLNTAKVTWKMPTPIEGYRDRGDDQRELTLKELLTQSYLQEGTSIDVAAARADMHDRLSRAALLIFLPFISVVLGLQLGRVARSGGLAVAILLLLVVQKLLEFGLSLAQRGVVPPWAGTWPVVALVAGLAIYTFRRTASGRSAFPSLRAVTTKAPANT
ncbi:MAG: LptF/LptG family permease [Roseovarius sp.]|nr:LptF/LptG family permease [Roseovarius sp.]